MVLVTGLISTSLFALELWDDRMDLAGSTLHLGGVDSACVRCKTQMPADPVEGSHRKHRKWTSSLEENRVE